MASVTVEFGVVRVVRDDGEEFSFRPVGDVAAAEIVAAHLRAALVDAYQAGRGAARPGPLARRLGTVT